MRAIWELGRAHPTEQVEVLVNAARAMGRIRAGLGQGTAMLAHLVGAERVHIGEALRDQALGEPVQLLVVIRRVVLAAVPVEPQPLDVFPDRVDVLNVFLDRVGVVKAQVAVAAKFGGDAEVEANRLGVPDVQVAVRLGREARDDLAAVGAGGDVGGHNLTDEIQGFGGLADGGHRCIHVWHSFQTIPLSQLAAQGAPASTASTIRGLRPLRDRL